ncbi:MAG: pyridoxamine 5'-phosphate oxidase family protein [Pseudomonadales bacterium]|jgi:PPOX class probable FMN-dependent enzyme|tara:strand:- start:861 stop:1481 length:621 start_codon:yes stop_codon:yes gene_type:complete
MTHEIKTEKALRDLIGNPVHELVVVKTTPIITAPIRRYIERSPFVCLATYGIDGACDLSPRGDPPGFVKVLNEKTLFLPERPGNKRLDSAINIIQQPQLSLMFMIPGTLETVRVNGTGVMTTDPELLSLSSVNGKSPELGVLITVGEALGHCSKAFRRSKLWQSDYARRDGVPSLAELMTGHLDLDEALTAELDAGIKNDVLTRMY